MSESTAEVVEHENPATALAFLRARSQASKRPQSYFYLVATEQALMLRILDPDTSAKDLAGLARALAAVRDQLRIIAGTPLPGSRRPSEKNDKRGRSDPLSDFQPVSVQK
jgi:hypothetical protein